MPENKYSAPSQGGSNTPARGRAPDSGFTQNEIPQLSQPKGGGAIHQIDQKFNVNTVNGN